MALQYSATGPHTLPTRGHVILALDVTMHCAMLDQRFIRRWNRRGRSYGLKHYVVWRKPDVSEEHRTSVFRVEETAKKVTQKQATRMSFGPCLRTASCTSLACDTPRPWIWESKCSFAMSVSLRQVQGADWSPEIYLPVNNCWNCSVWLWCWVFPESDK